MSADMTTQQRSKTRIRRTYLSRHPQDIDPNGWFYEERKGMRVYADRGILIPWRMIDASRKRARQEKRARAK